MPTITIPKRLIREENLVIIPRKEYEALLDIKKKKKSRTELDRDLDEAIAEVRAGKAIGPFDNARDLLKSLKSKK